MNSQSASDKGERHKRELVACIARHLPNLDENSISWWTGVVPASYHSSQNYSQKLINFLVGLDDERKPATRHNIFLSAPSMEHFIGCVCLSLPILTKSNAQRWIEHPHELRDFLSGLSPRKEKYLEYGDFYESPLSTSISVKGNFDLDEDGVNRKLQISYLPENFKEWFLNKKPEDLSGVLAYHTPREFPCHFAIDYPGDKEVRAELGDSSITTIADILNQIRLSFERPSRSILLPDEGANIFFVRDCLGAIRTVIVSFSGYHGWGFVTHPFGDPPQRSFGGFGGYREYRVFSKMFPK